MCDAGRIAPLGKNARQFLRDLGMTVSQRQQHDACIRRQSPAIESGCDLLASDRWKYEGQNRIVDHGGCGGLDVSAELV
jgi:hypothetical protein